VTIEDLLLLFIFTYETMHATATLKWRRENVGGQLPVPRAGMGASIVGGDKIVGFGGLNNETGWLNTVVALQLWPQPLQWLPTTAPSNNSNDNNNTPTPRDKLVSFAFGDDKLVIFGGFGPTELEEEEIDDDDEDEGPSADFTWFNDAWVLDTRRWEWQRVEVVGAPVPRAATALAHIGGGVGYLFGGRGAAGRLDDFYRFTFTPGSSDENQGRPKIVWESLGGVAGGNSDASSTSKPCARSFHSMVAVSPSRLVVYGGVDVNDVQLNDLHIYDVERQAWYKPSGYQRVDSIAQVVQKSSSESSAASNNTNNNTPAPPAPFSHKGASTKMAYDDKNQLLFLFGGSSSGDLLVINAKPIVDLPSSSLPSQQQQQQ